MLERVAEARAIEFSGVRAGGDAQRQRRDRAVPEAMAPCGRRRTEVPVPGLEAHAVERRDHQRDDRAMRVADRRRQRTGRARRVLEDREIVGARVGGVPIALIDQARRQVIDVEHLDVLEQRAPACGVALHDQQPRLGVVHAQRHPVRPEQREERDRDRAALHRAEERAVERQRWLEHDRDAIAAGDALTSQEVGEASRPPGELHEAVLGDAPVGERDAQRGAATDVPVDALVRDVQPLAVAVDEVPERLPPEGAKHVGIRANPEQWR